MTSRPTDGKHLDYLHVVLVLQHFSAGTYSMCPPITRIVLQQHLWNALWVYQGWRANTVMKQQPVHAVNTVLLNHFFDVL